MAQQLIDQMADIVRILCGEATFKGYEDLCRDYLDEEEKAYGGGFASKIIRPDVI